MVNRGMNGYTSRMGGSALPLILEEILGAKLDTGEESCIITDDNIGNKGQYCTQDQQDQTDVSIARPIPQYTFLIGYGANDSCLHNGSCSRHHVPLNEYASNLDRMIEMIQSWNGNLSTSVALLTPPPCDTNVKGDGRDNESVTIMYAQEVIKIGKERDVPVVDLWNGMQLPIQNIDATSSSTSIEEYGDAWKKDYLSDGLHLTPLGNYKMFELVVEMLENDLGLTVEQIPRQHPDHSLVDAEHPEKTFGARK